MKPATLERTIFKTSRLLEFCSRKELINQTGHPVAQWPLVILKELVDNAIDACEEAQTPPVISVSVNRGEITVTDNGPGLKPGTVTNILDYRVRVSSREAYVSPTRGAQGNALKTIVAMPFALNGGNFGRVTIEAHKVAHHIEFRVDQIRQEPKIDHVKEASNIKIGTRITVHWPDSARPSPVTPARRPTATSSPTGSENCATRLSPTLKKFAPVSRRGLRWFRRLLGSSRNAVLRLHPCVLACSRHILRNASRIG
jgi:hypothetical protein